ncbi:MAG TPA: inorganic phosphate transporter [Gemmataceae bacterium]|nr:inorganic phosphate transporter [Gemmataceae bacterium]
MHFFQSAAEHLGTVPWGQLSLAVWLLIALALLFDFLNGFHDSANSVATIVSTRVLSPQTAVLWAAFFNFVAFLLFHLKVAATMGKDIIDPTIVNNQVIAATLIAACFWDILTWYWGLPTSSSHALIGGLVGAGIAQARGISALKWDGIGKTVVFIVLAPLIGMIIGLLIALAVAWLFRRASPRRVDKLFRRGQLLSASLYSLGHGGNDAQKTMGIIFLLLIVASQGNSSFATPTEVPTEVVLACHTAMGLGTLFGGWRIVKTMGQRIIRLRPVDGFCAETGAAVTLGLTVFGGVPVSTTHTITGAIVGVGSLKRLSAVRWGVAGRVVWAWILTIPGTAIVSMICWWLLSLFS